MKGDSSIFDSVQSGITVSRRTVASWVEKTERNFPRLFNIVFVFLLPLIALLCWALFCGHFLAVIESEGELQANNEILATNMTKIMEHHRMLFQIRRNEAAMEKERNMGCLDEFMNSTLSEMINGTELRTFMENCIASADDEVKFSPYGAVKNADLESFYNGIGDFHLQFDWNKCSEDPDQWSQFEERWYESFTALYEQYTGQEGLNEEEAFSRAAEEAKGNDACKVNTGGGGLFWFTIMTTIGYGNAAPATDLGCWFVMILGLPSILMFTATLGAIGYVSLAIADDLFHRLNMSKMTKGWNASIFWFCIFVLSMLALAGMANLFIFLTGWKEFHESANLPSLTFIHSFWFAFATMTTVGLGDIHIPHHIFDVHHMFILPLITLMGFISLANFLLKLSDTIWGIAVKRKLLPNNVASLRAILKDDRNNDAGDECHEIGRGRNGDAYNEAVMFDPNRAWNEGLKHEFLPVRSIKKNDSHKVVTFDPRNHGDQNIHEDGSCHSPPLRKKEGDHESSYNEQIKIVDQNDVEGGNDMKEKMQDQDCFPVRIPS